MRRGTLLVRRLLLAAMVLAALGCDATAPSTDRPSATPGTPAPVAPPRLGIDWGRAASVERPANFQETVPPSYPAKHPILRIQGQATPTDIASLPGGGLVVIGYVPPDWAPVAWTSADGNSWAIHSVEDTDFTFPVSLATGADGTVVAVGRSGNQPLAWTTADGASWQRHAVPVLGSDGVAERMTAVARGSQGFVAGGSVGPELFERHARFWRSADGITWEPVTDDPVAFANAEVRGLTAFGDGFVAVGVVGTAQEHTGAAAWTSPDGATWTRVDGPAFEGGEAVSVVPAPFGGLVAVGSQVDRRSALAWISPDGRAWTRAPDQPSLQHSGGFAWLTDVVAIGDLVVAVGDIQGLQRGTAMAWVSRDGLSWERSSRSPVQEGAEWYAIAPGGTGAIVVGAFGAPDSYVPEVWVTPGR
jgi:hypothetical protein